jgi:hypothetical protein
MTVLTVKQPVAQAPTYEVLQSGSYEPLDLVPCGRIADNGQVTCAFLAETCAPAEIENQL